MHTWCGARFRNVRGVRLGAADLALELAPDVMQRESMVLAGFAKESGDDVFARYGDDRRLARAQHDGAVRSGCAHQPQFGERPIGVSHRVEIDAPFVRGLPKRWQEIAWREGA